MKIKMFLIVFITSLFIGFCFINDVKQNNYINIKDDNELWRIYDINIQEIENNMSPIADSNDTFEWYNLKKLSTDDKNYEKYLNSLFISVNQCYVDLENPNNIYTEPNSVKKYRNKDEILINELNDLKIDNSFSDIKSSCIEKFQIYENIKIDSNDENKKYLLDMISDVLDLSENYFIEDPQDYSDYVYNQIIETEILVKVSSFLNNEYYRLK